MINVLVMTVRVTRVPKVIPLKDSTRRCARFGVGQPRPGYGEKKRWDFYDVTVWESLVDPVVKHCRKACWIVIRGHLQENRWVDADGKRHSKPEIIADWIEKPPRWKVGSVDGTEANGLEVEQEPDEADLQFAQGLDGLEVDLEELLGAQEERSVDREP